MARSIATIQASIVAAIQGNSVLAELTSTSAVAIWRLMAYVVAVCQWTIEVLFDHHVAEVNAIIAAGKPHTLQWYVVMAKAFQYGYALPDDSDVYDNTGIDPALVTASIVVAYAAATESLSGVRLKVAATSGTQLAPLSGPQLTAFTTYMKLVRDAGVRLQCTSGPADRFVWSGNIYYDPLVLDGLGKRLDGTDDTPVQEAIVAFLAALPFNGIFTLNYFLFAVQQVAGVRIAQNVLCQASYAALPLQTVTLDYQPDSGYMDIDVVRDLVLAFIPH